MGTRPLAPTHSIEILAEFAVFHKRLYTLSVTCNVPLWPMTGERAVVDAPEAVALCERVTEAVWAYGVCELLPRQARYVFPKLWIAGG